MTTSVTENNLDLSDLYKQEQEALSLIHIYQPFIAKKATIPLIKRMITNHPVWEKIIDVYKRQHQWKFIDNDGEDRAIDGTIKKHRGRPNKREAVTLRFKNLANGSKSLYFDIYYNGERKYEFLKLYINPEITEADKQNNALVMETAERLKERKMREVVNGETFTDPSDELNQVEKVEEYTSSVIVRSRKMRNGDRSLFLDIYYGKGQRAYESVGLYLRKDDSEEKHKEIWKEAEKKAKERMKALKDGTFEKRVGRLSLIHIFPCIFPTKNIPVYNKIYRITKTNIRTPYSYNRKDVYKRQV